MVLLSYVSRLSTFRPLRDNHSLNSVHCRVSNVLTHGELRYPCSA